MKWKINEKLYNGKDFRYRIDYTKGAPSDGARRLKDFLKISFPTHLIYEEYRIPTTRLRIDFLDATAGVAFEYDDNKKSGHHVKFVEFFHKTKFGFLSNIKRELKKEQILEENGIKLVRIYKQDFPMSLKKLEKKLNEAS